MFLYRRKQQHKNKAKLKMFYSFLIRSDALKLLKISVNFISLVLLFSYEQWNNCGGAFRCTQKCKLNKQTFLISDKICSPNMALRII